MDKELTLNLQIDQSSESLKRLCNGLVAAVKPDGGYAAATTDDPAPGACGDQMVQVEWWIPQHGCDSLENTLDAIKGRLLVAVRDWFATALVPAAAPVPDEGEVGELVADLEVAAVTVESEGGDHEAAAVRRAATLLQQQATELAALRAGVVPVAVSERPWEREGWCDEQGRCWFLSSRFLTWSLASPPVALTCQIARLYSLPFHAIPLPPHGGEVE